MACEDVQRKQQDIDEDGLLSETQALPPTKLFHVFFSYSENDRKFVQHLVGKLENEYGMKCCDHLRDFIPGWTVLDNMKHSVMNSLRTVVIISTSSTKSIWCSFETELALHMSMDMRKKILIPMVIDGCEVPDDLKPLTHIDARDSAAHWLPKLLLAVKSPLKVPAFENGLPSLSSEPFSFNPHYGNLDASVTLTSKSRNCWREEFQTKSFQNALCSRGMQVPYAVFKEQIRKINVLMFPSYHCCRNYKKCWSIFAVVVIVYFVLTISFCLSLKCQTKHTDTECKNGCFSWISLAVLLTVGFAAYIVVIIRRRSSRLKQMVDINRHLLPYQVIATYRSWTSKRHDFITFAYYNYQPCLDHINYCLEKAVKSSGVYFNQQGSSEKKETSSDKVPLLEETCRVSITDDENDSEDSFKSRIQELSTELALKYSAEYLRQIYEVDLPRPDTPRHCRQVVCLCEFVEMKENLDNTVKESYSLNQNRKFFCAQSAIKLLTSLCSKK